MRKLSLLIAFFSLTSISLNAQTQGVAYTAVGKGVATTFLTDYHCLGVNSSMLGFGTGYEGKKFTTGMTEFSLGIYSDALNKEKLGKLYKTLRNDLFGKEQDPAAWQEQAEYAADYLDAGIMLDATYNWFGFSFQSERFGGIAFNVQEHYNWYSKLSPTTTDIIFRGKLSSYFDSLTVVFGTDTSMIANGATISQDTLDAVISGSMGIPLQLSTITNGSEIKFAWNRYYNIGYGKKLFGDSTFAIFGGIGARWIQSTAMFNLTSDDDGLVFSSSMSPSFDIDYGAVASGNPSSFSKSGGLPAAVGNGYGLDFSVSAQIAKYFKIGLAVNNLGSVTYNRNVYRVNDTLITEVRLDGMEDYNITNSMDQFLEEGGLLTLEGQEKVKINNAANIRLGASIDFGRFASIGIDVVAPFNRENPGGINNAVYSIGGEVRPAKWVAISAGYYGGGIYAHNIPVGINFILGKGTYEFGIASRDALSFFLKDEGSVSTAFGVARFRF